MNNTLAFAPDSKSRESFHEWRCAILDQAASVLSDPAQPIIQAQTGMWEIGSAMPYPSRSDMTILSNGCLVFDVAVAEYRVHFGIWMIMGEIRVGVKIPIHLLPTTEHRRHISECYDGIECQRQVDIGDTILFDWIFRDGFASFESMQIALRDTLMGSMIATRTGEILTHLYLATISSLIADNAYEIRMSRIEKPSRRVKKTVVFKGDMDSFITFAQDRHAIMMGGASVSADGSITIQIETDDSGSGLSCGFHRDVDGGVFDIISIEPSR